MTVSDAPTPATSGRRDERLVAYVVLAHADTRQLRLLVDTLLGDERSVVYLHMDARAPAPGWAVSARYATKVTLVPPVRVNWAGFSMVEATLRLLKASVAQPRCQRFVLLSGSCFPIRPVRRINDMLLATGNHMALWKRVAGPGAAPTAREAYAASKLHFMDLGLLNPSRGKMRRVLWRAYDWTNARLPYRRDGDGVIVKGSQWFAIDRKLAQEFLAATVSLRRRFRFTFAPDEMALQTLYWKRCTAAGSLVSFVEQTASLQALHFIRFKPVPAGRPFAERLTRTYDRRLLDLGDLDAALRSDALFARKCPPELCEALLAATATQSDAKITGPITG